MWEQRVICFLSGVLASLYAHLGSPSTPSLRSTRLHILVSHAVYILLHDFTKAAGSEIHGDVYLEKN